MNIHQKMRPVLKCGLEVVEFCPGEDQETDFAVDVAFGFAGQGK
jgi:hypothetical protein